jgi:hypothetical protein
MCLVLTAMQKAWLHRKSRPQDHGILYLIRAVLRDSLRNNYFARLSINKSEDFYMGVVDYSKNQTQSIVP